MILLDSPTPTDKTARVSLRFCEKSQQRKLAAKSFNMYVMYRI